MREYLMVPGEFAKYLGIDIKTYFGWENNLVDLAVIIADKLNKDFKKIWYVD